MKKILLLLIGLAGASMLFAQTNMVRLTRFTDKNITGVSASSGFDVEVFNSDKTSVVVEINAELEPYLIYEITPEGVVKLGIRSNESNRKLRIKDREVNAKVYLNHVKELTASSGSVIKGIGSFKGDNATITASSGSDIKEINLTAQNVKVASSSGSKVGANIDATDINLKVSSGSKAKGNFKTVKGLLCNVSSSASAELVHNGFSGTFNLSSAASVSISGRVENAFIETSSASSFKGGDYNAQSASAVSSSASSIYLGVVGKLDAVASSAASIRYKGTPVINRVSTSSAASIKKMD